MRSPAVRDASLAGCAARRMLVALVAFVGLVPVTFMPAPGPVVAAEGTPGPAAPGSSGLHGTWLIDGYQTLGGPWMSPVIRSERMPEITFNVDGSFWGHTGCNSFSGDHAVDGERLDVDEVSATIMYCGEGALAMQESAILAVVQAATGWRSEPGAMHLTGPSGVVLLTGSAVDATVTRTWKLRLDSLPGAEHPPDESIGSPVTDPPVWQLTLAADGGFTSSAGCDPIAGRYGIDGAALRFEIPAGTPPSCGDVVDAQEATVLGILNATAMVAVNPSRLWLLDAAGGTLAEFSPSEAFG